MNLNLVTVENVRKIKDVLLNKSLVKPIKIHKDILDLKLEIDSVSPSELSANFDYDMDEVYFLKESSRKVLTIKNRKYELFFDVGEWGYQTRIPNSHITMGTDYSKYGDFFAQLELSQALEDDKCIYIVKNLNKLSGNGAIARLNHGLGSNKAAKSGRRTFLQKKLNKDVISYDNNDWLCIYKINKADLNNEEKQNGVLHEFLMNFLEYAFCIEEIIIEDVKLLNLPII